MSSYKPGSNGADGNLAPMFTASLGQTLDNADRSTAAIHPMVFLQVSGSPDAPSGSSLRYTRRMSEHSWTGAVFCCRESGTEAWRLRAVGRSGGVALSPWVVVPGCVVVSRVVVSLWRDATIARDLAWTLFLV